MDPGETEPGADELASWPTGRLLAVAARLVEQQWTSVLAELGLTHAGLIVLHLLGEGPLAQRALARRCEVTDQTMSRTLERLSREGFVARAPDPADSRRRLVAITAAGREVHARAVRAERDRIGLSGTGIADDQLREQLVQLISGLREDRPAASPAGRDGSGGSGY
ncbi:MarR family transcriptional regulator [Amycolatopsis sp. FU40]|uniref:MarR family winged helix-turn-helix transcriptional regulator n=1 Tax=Amycolatopsis sp. FU40 TaxID=2914159 RepID=UPI001F01B1E5|nr:MarR family transcriptional regulator [Amycolatopsis sp. FU40]UKD57308.1 MarR family transcriptional regulator [Amycolatopsis sp. FU40]